MELIVLGAGDEEVMQNNAKMALTCRQLHLADLNNHVVQHTPTDTCMYKVSFNIRVGSLGLAQETTYPVCILLKSEKLFCMCTCISA